MKIEVYWSAELLSSHWAVDDYQTETFSLIVEAKGALLKSSLAFVAAVIERVTLHLKVHLNYSFPYDHVVIKQCSMFKQCFLFTNKLNVN